MVFHHINAYEENGHVVFDLITYENSGLYDMFYMENMRKNVEEDSDVTIPTAVSQRFVIPVNAQLKVSDNMRQTNSTISSNTRDIEMISDMSYMNE